MSISAVGGPQSSSVSSLDPKRVIGEVAGAAPSEAAVSSLNRPDAVAKVANVAEADKKSAADTAQLNQAVDALQKAVTPHAQELTFSVDNDTGRTVIKLTDTTTDTVVRQIPPKEVLEMAKELEKTQGLLLNQKA